MEIASHIVKRFKSLVWTKQECLYIACTIVKFKEKEKLFLIFPSFMYEHIQVTRFTSCVRVFEQFKNQYRRISRKEKECNGRNLGSWIIHNCFWNYKNRKLYQESLKSRQYKLCTKWGNIFSCRKVSLSHFRSFGTYSSIILKLVSFAGLNKQIIANISLLCDSLHKRWILLTHHSFWMRVVLSVQIVKYKNIHLT